MACSTPATIQERDAAMVRLKRIAEAELFMDISALDAASLSKEELEKKEIEIAKSANVSCIEPLEKKLNSALQFVPSNQDVVHDAAKKTDAINTEFNACLKVFGATGFFGVETEGESIHIGEWLRRLWAASSYAAYISDKANQESYDNGLLILGAIAGAASNTQYPVNPNQLYVAPQFRNGSLVNGHLRTRPNFTCLDNIRGCR
jgi:type V secretory pathway adhesin AidA